MLLRLENISHAYKNGQGLIKRENYVLRDVNLSIEEAEIVGLLGSSGSGKTTIGRIITGLVKASSGKLYFKDRELKYPCNKDIRRRIQVLFQHPETVFNPCLTIEQSLREVYKLYGIDYSRGELIKMLSEYGIYEEHIGRYPAQLSGGELQRIALARVLLLEPELIVLDEPTSMLDSISQAQMMQMLLKVREEKKIAFLFITHDEILCRFFADKIIRIKEGRCTEETDNAGLEQRIG